MLVKTATNVDISTRVAVISFFEAYTTKRIGKKIEFGISLGKWNERVSLYY